MLRRETAKTKRQRLDVARHIIKEILSYEGFIVNKKIKFGPRYYVAQGKYNSLPAIFKICLFSDSVDHLTNEKFSREIHFLNFIQNSKHNKLKKAVPSVYASGIRPRAWYIRKNIIGRAQNLKGGNVRFKTNFFTQKNQEWFIALEKELQSIQNNELPSHFKKLLYPPDFTKHLWRFISPHWLRIETFMKWPGVARLIKKEFKQYAPIYNRAPRVLAHQEPYSCHILKTAKGLHLIDWENIGWSNPTHDIVALWMRAYQKTKVAKNTLSSDKAA